MLNSVGNYNYALPYSNETTHGMLLLLVTAFVMARWSGKRSRAGAFLLGLCGGVAAVLNSCWPQAFWEAPHCFCVTDGTNRSASPSLG